MRFREISAIIRDTKKPLTHFHATFSRLKSFVFKIQEMLENLPVSTRTCSFLILEMTKKGKGKSLRYFQVKFIDRYLLSCSVQYLQIYQFILLYYTKLSQKKKNKYRGKILAFFRQFLFSNGQIPSGRYRHEHCSAVATIQKQQLRVNLS